MTDDRMRAAGREDAASCEDCSAAGGSTNGGLANESPAGAGAESEAPVSATPTGVDPTSAVPVSEVRANAGPASAVPQIEGAARDCAVTGTVLKSVGGLFTLRLDDGSDVVCPARGRFRYEGEVPLPGDRVEAVREKDAWALSAILARRNSLIRPALANLTHLVAVIPACRPKPDVVTADKLICAAEDAMIEPVIVINKADLDPSESARLAEVYRQSSFEVFELSARSGEGVGALGEYLFSQKSGDSMPLVVFSGASGAGKSTLMSQLFPALKLKTGDVSRKSERGRHTTRTAELFDVGGLFVADTPGFTMLDFAEYNFLPRENLAFSFREFADYVGKCRYTKCTHTKEEGCAILEAVEAGNIRRERHESYVAIRAEMLKTPEWKKKKSRK